MAESSANPNNAVAEEAPTLSLLILEIGGERYGVPSASVQEIVRYRPWTVVPGAPPTLPGIISQRGLILPVVDVRALLGLPETEPARSTRFVVIHQQEIDMALLVDRVIDLTMGVESAFVPLPGAADARRGRFIRGVAEVEDRPLALFDLDAVIAALREGT